MTINSLVFRLTAGSTTIASAFTISEERGNLQRNFPRTSQPRNTADCVVKSQILTTHFVGNYSTVTKLQSTVQGEPSPHLVRRNKMSWKQKRTSYPFLSQISSQKKKNKTQTQQTKHSVTGDFCSNLDLNTAVEEPSLSAFVQIFV